ncbi:MAG: hypothetical protein FJ271_06305 [Planctomycetes bacterium]|nr:hypothetical protein [Planctomycetota bacterium]
MSHAILLLALCQPCAAGCDKASSPTPVLLDTDIGSDIDDAFALALVLASPELDLRGVTTVSGDTHARAMMVCAWLSRIGRNDVPVAAGKPPQPACAIAGQIQYVRHPAVIFNRTSKPARQGAVALLHQQLKKQPGQTILALGPLTNIAALLREHPECKPWIQRIVLMGGSLRAGYDGKPGRVAEYNIKTDIAAARAVFRSGVPLLVVPLDVTAQLRLGEAERSKIFAAGGLSNQQLQCLYQLWDQETPILFDPAAVALCIDEKHFKLRRMLLDVDDDGMTHIGLARPNARLAFEIKEKEFLAWFTDRLARPVKSRPAQAPVNVATLLPRGNMPKRVHVCEDFDTDIERRWWMSGKRETKNLPPGRSACRGVLTQDFDDRMGDMKAMYTAVIFNPVPGPPMGPRTRLSFRYYLKGSDTLRVQIYSLTNGYHRHLTLTRLPQGAWHEATVDMTVARRPDGSGKALAENERIDDIQFYTDPTAELIISDIVLYEAAEPDEKRPFPTRLHFTGWFDTGKQGKEWPGDFDIVAHKPPRTWKCARSVKRDDRSAWIRLDLRGPRPVGANPRLFFRYHLAGADRMEVVLVNRTTRARVAMTLKAADSRDWAQTTMHFARVPGTVDEIHFLVPADAVLQVDDVLLYSEIPPARAGS